MPIEVWVNETLYPGWDQHFRMKRELARLRSDFQEILVFESYGHGRVMLLDGIVQITEADEFTYQEMLAHVPLLAHGAAKRVLIIGAGDGGVLRRVLQHKRVERAVMVEIDGEVIRLAKEYLPAIGGDAWTDPRAEVIVGDGIDYVRKAAPGSFDVVIVDSTDPIGVGEVLFTEEFYANCARLLTDRGLVVNQCGVPFMQAEELRDSSLRRAKVFADVAAYLVAVPTYVGGFMTLGWAAKDPAMRAVGVDEIRHRAKARAEHADHDLDDPRRQDLRQPDGRRPDRLGEAEGSRPPDHRHRHRPRLRRRGGAAQARQVERQGRDRHGEDRADAAAGDQAAEEGAGFGARGDRRGHRAAPALAAARRRRQLEGLRLAAAA